MYASVVRSVCSIFAAWGGKSITTRFSTVCQ
jgi:hypothetical protein